MCTQLFTAAMSQPDTSGAMIEGGGNAQAAGMGINALGELAAGVTRARAARAEASLERAAGEQRARRIRTAGEQELASARSAAVGAGVKLTSGSVMEAERQIVRNVEQDALIALVNGESRASASEAQGRYYQAAAIGSAADTLYGAADKWKRTRRAQVDYGAIQQIPARPYNPAGDGFVTDPLAGA